MLNISDMRPRTPFLGLVVVPLRDLLAMVFPGAELTYSVDGPDGSDSEGSA